MNKELLMRTHAAEYHAAGYTGSRAHVVVLDGNTDGHIHNVCQALKVFALDVKCAEFRFTTTDGKAAAYEYIAKHKDDIDVINASLGGTSIAAQSFLPLKDYDIPIVAAAGNDGRDERIAYPGRYDWTIAIGAYNLNLNSVAVYSNGGSELDAVAFTNVRIINRLGNEMSFSGTSCAAPTATGLLTLIADYRKSKGLPRLNTEEARRFIHHNCIDLYEPGHDYRSGHGLFVLPELATLQASWQPPEPPREEVPVVENNTDGWIIVHEGKAVEALNKDGHTYVPVRAFAEAMGFKLAVDNQQKIVTLSK